MNRKSFSPARIAGALTGALALTAVGAQAEIDYGDDTITIHESVVIEGQRAGHLGRIRGAIATSPNGSPRCSPANTPKATASSAPCAN